MYVETIKYESKLTVVEWGGFMSEYVRIGRSPIDTPVLEDSGLLVNDIYLGNKFKPLEDALAAYELSMKRVRKYSQTPTLKELDKKRMKSFSGIFSNIRSMVTDLDEEKSAAASLLLPLLYEYRGYSSQTVSARSTLIRKFIDALKSEKYVSAYQTLELEERATELNDTNEQYILLSSERAEEEKNHPACPSKLRKQCVKAYRDLVDLINFALANNKYYIYDEIAASLSAITAKTQELINRRRNGMEAETESEEAEVETETTPTEE